MVVYYILSVLIPIAILIYVIGSLSTIKHQQKMIMKHLGIEEETEKLIPNEKIERELEDELLK
ncbi:hypothetical protein BKP35_13250 [Anaerobacillus arseniciselenatis]|uniref:Uncharacterized protein n=1 Tax=Anaerobacillus arseniciselenatis TaxID=85682 RepID=A0A1S2LEI8_9BACI|nr:hypothetical protein [Anaerobacillus arseniciselenatis]OIJ10650.1 hypothetical protein BKP35_13250 [Anaerobacillus arseniciselenatis]